MNKATRGFLIKQSELIKIQRDLAKLDQEFVMECMDESPVLQKMVSRMWELKKELGQVK